MPGSRARPPSAVELHHQECRAADEARDETRLASGTLPAMTAKEKLRDQIEAFSEAEAQEMLQLLELRTDPLVIAFRDAPIDDEPLTSDEEAALAEADRDIASGRTIALEDLKRELGDV